MCKDFSNASKEFHIIWGQNTLQILFIRFTKNFKSKLVMEVKTDSIESYFWLQLNLYQVSKSIIQSFEWLFRLVFLIFLWDGHVVGDEILLWAISCYCCTLTFIMILFFNLLLLFDMVWSQIYSTLETILDTIPEMLAGGS